MENCLHVEVPLSKILKTHPSKEYLFVFGISMMSMKPRLPVECNVWIYTTEFGVATFLILLALITLNQPDT